ncbi:hypothetical protein C7999DRAFT_18179 [Corynascus novoguineensis]|uniref:Geranylgeranyl pyrophosphate synthetase n=1 Tax=Corynascus novoguineensis TaxID=1126955 RepID=A0AAN7CKS1_9PEZI|nr:hypothetical protein C7999DRAFT_18179 [Corynascus novoguineensis]
MAASWYRKSYSQSWIKARKEPRLPPAPETPAPPFGELIRTLRLEDLEDSSRTLENSARVKELQSVTSFSWVDKSAHGPEILIPGRPPLWTPQVTPTQLKEDRGSYYRDKNAARYHKHPIEPAVVASLEANPALLAGLDVFACGSTLGNLLRFVRGEEKVFRMLAYKVQNTIFLVRRENSPTELIPNVRGYGHTFPEANTTWEADVKGSASHQRVIRYTFGGLNLAVRFEADGYIKSRNDPADSEKSSPSSSSSAIPSLDELTTALSTAKVTISTVPSSTNTTTTTNTINASPQLPKITRAGAPVPHTTLFDLKTRSIRTRDTKDHLAEELPRLWVRQIPTFVLAFHTRGLFRREDTEVQDVRAEVAQWEQKHATELAKLAALLSRVRDVLFEEGKEEEEEAAAGWGGAVEICRRVGWRDELEFRKPGGEVAGALSDEVMKWWVRAVSAGQGTQWADEGKDFTFTAHSDFGAGEVESWEAAEDADFTACSADHCGYCGRCSY